MKCPVCKGNIKRGTTNLPVEIERGILFIKSVPADVCDQCEEVFIPDEVASLVEKIVAKARDMKVELEVISYEAVA
ncbi:MAG TPA: type II toxin-antitoxin system MqsA family antitoxin [Candidatus Brocadiia bacterium]|nr:type II toxin-antitoxin system MqsA family antitoxin [Candidatus Brocadiales bacterium]